MERPGDRRLLSIYLNDHRAGAAAGANLARRVADAAAGTPREAELTALANQIDEDRAFLHRLMEEHDIAVRRSKVAAGWLTERLSRLKSNGRFLRRSPLSDIVELEGLLAGVEAKRALWSTMHVSATTTASAEQLDEYLERAESQRARLEEQHRQTAASTPLAR